MIQQNKNAKLNCKQLTMALLAFNVVILTLLNGAEARDRGEDIILAKGKLIMRGSKGNIIMDSGSKSHEHSMMPMMPLMGHHFNPYSFYPMQHHHQHHQQPPMMIHPVYVEDHSAMHHQPEQHHSYHHEEPHYQHHEVQYSHHSPEHHEVHHEPQHEMHHEPMHHEMHHYESEGHGEEEGHHGGYESHPMMSMIMHGSGLQPAYQQLAAMQAAQQPSQYALHLQAQSFPGQQVDIQQHQQMQQQQQQQNQQPQQASESETQSKKSSLLDQSSNNPLAAIIRPLFKRGPAKQQKKP